MPKFNAWLQCYTKLSDAVDGIGRRIWFHSKHHSSKSRKSGSISGGGRGGSGGKGKGKKTGKRKSEGEEGGEGVDMDVANEVGMNGGGGGDAEGVSGGDVEGVGGGDAEGVGGGKGVNAKKGKQGKVKVKQEVDESDAVAVVAPPISSTPTRATRKRK